MRETPVPLDISTSLDGLMDPNEEIRLTAATDIGPDGRFGQRHLGATDKRLFLDRKQVGALMSRVTQDSGALQGFLVQGLPYLGTNLLMLIGIVYVLFSMNAHLALLVLLPTPALVGGGVFFWRRIRPRFRRIWEKWARLSALLSNAMSGIKVVKAFAQEDREIRRFDERNFALVQANLQAQWMTSAFFPLMGFLMGLGTFIVWWIGGKDVLSGDLTLGTLMAFIAYLGMFYAPLQFLSQLNQMFSGAPGGCNAHL